MLCNKGGGIMNLKKMEDGAIEIAKDLEIPIVGGVLKMIQALHTDPSVKFDKRELMKALMSDKEYKNEAFDLLLTDKETIDNLDENDKMLMRSICR